MAPFSAIWRVVGRVRDILTLSPSSSSSSRSTPTTPATPGENNTCESVDDTARPAAATTVARRTTLTAGPVKVAKMAKMTLKWLAGRPVTPTPAVREQQQQRASNAGGAPAAIPRFQPKTLAKSWTVAMFRSIQSKVRIYSKPVALPPASPSRVHAPTISEDPIAPVSPTIDSPSNVTSGAGANRTFTSDTNDVTPPLTSTSSSFDSVVPPSRSPSLRGRRTPVSLSLIAQPHTTIRLDITTLDADYDLRESGSSNKFGGSVDQCVKGTLGHGGFTPIGFLPEDGALSGDGLLQTDGPEDIDVVLVDREVNEPWLDKPINAPPQSAQTGEVDDDEFRYEEQQEEEEERFEYQEQSQTPDDESRPDSRPGFDAQSSIAQVEGWVLADLDQAAQSLEDTVPPPSAGVEPIVEPPSTDAEPLVLEPESLEPDTTDETLEDPAPEAPSPAVSEPLVQSDPVIESPPTPSPNPPTEVITNPSSSASSPITSASVTPSVAPSVSDSASSAGRPRFQGIQSLVERRISQAQTRTSPSGASPNPAAPAGRDAFRRVALQVQALQRFSAPRVPVAPPAASINPESMRKATTRSMRKFGSIVEQELQAVEEMKASLSAIKEANKSKLSGSAKDVTPPSSTKLSAIPSLPPVLEHEPLQQVRSPIHRQVQLIAREVSEEPKKVGKPEPTPRKSQSMNGPSKAQQPPEEKRAAEAFPALPQTSMLLAELPKTEAAGPAFQNGNLPSPFTEPDNISPAPSPPSAPRQRQLSNGSPMVLFQRQMVEIAKESAASFNAGVGKENNNPPSVTGEVENVAPTRSRRRRTSNNTSNSSTGSPSRQSPPSYASVASVAAPPKAVTPQPSQPPRGPPRPPPRRSATTSEQRPPRAYQQGQGQGQQQAYPRGGPNQSYKQAATAYSHNGSGYSQHASGGQNYNAPPINNNYAPPPPHRSFTARSNPNPPQYSAIEPPQPQARTQSFTQRPGQAQSQQQPPSSRPNSYSQSPSQPQRPQAVRNRRPRQATFA